MLSSLSRVLLMPSFSFLFIFLGISTGYATLNGALMINGTSNIRENDWNVYFSNVLLNGEQDLSIIESKQKLVFDFEFAFDFAFAFDFDFAFAFAFFFPLYSLPLPFSKRVFAVLKRVMIAFGKL